MERISESSHVTLCTYDESDGIYDIMCDSHIIITSFRSRTPSETPSKTPSVWLEEGDKISWKWMGRARKNLPPAIEELADAFFFLHFLLNTFTPCCGGTYSTVIQRFWEGRSILLLAEEYFVVRSKFFKGKTSPRMALFLLTDQRTKEFGKLPSDWLVVNNNKKSILSPRTFSSTEKISLTGKISSTEKISSMEKNLSTRKFSSTKKKPIKSFFRFSIKNRAW